MTYKPSDVQETGIRVLRSSNINEDTFVCGNDDVFVNPKTVNIDTVKQNDILITSANGSSRLVGKHALIKGIPNESAVHGGFMLLGRTKNYDFINASMNSSWYIKFINIYVTGGNGAIGNLSKSDLDEQLILVPSDLEQKKIGEYFANLDHLITLHQQKITLLTKLKKTMLEKMFPKKGTVIPEFRFNGFANAWEQRKLGELYQRNTERNENFIGYDKTISVATMSYKDDGNGASESSLSTYKVLRVGDIAFEGHTNKQFRFGRFVVNDIGTGIMSPRFSALRPLNEMPVNFWKQYIHSESVIRGILVKSTKAGTMMNELVIPEFLNQTIMVPSENEQAVIGQYFASLENLITLHQRKIDKLKNLKKAMLDQMFI
ncbi:restriction endonuclease subunit S [Ligilactobacillus ruminis]|uniref:restriction endonuclease subunit S n=1 Tax=Ligilactobacillus ruminis TaxID=1623 RepID=UPI002658EAB4|nr:restriction endonuclease subunit S [Ligilactobacillus ruminis]WKB71564.1 restriction endonuclease subunit S [Ligilactobacillus ruminis]